MAQNRLEIILSANTRDFQSGLRKAEQDARKTGADIARSFIDSADGVGRLESAVEEAADSFSGVASKADSELSRVERAAIEAGSALDKSFDNLDVSRTTREVNFLEQALENAGYSVGALDDVADSLDDIGDSAKGAGDKLGDAFQAQAVADFAGQVSDAGKQIGDFFEGAAADARNIDREIRKTFSDPKDVENFSRIVGNLKAEFGDLANSEGLTKALQKLESGGIANEEELRRVINIAEATGRSYEEVAEKQAEFFASAKGGVVNVQVLNEYRKTIGAGAKDLEKFGVVLDDNNQIVADTPEQIKKAQDALRAYIDGNARFNDVLERSQDNMDKFDAQVGALNESIGVQVNEFKNYVAGGLLPLVKGLNGSSDSIKQFIGLSIAGGSAIAEYGGKLAQFAFQAKAAGVSVTGIKNAMVAARTATVAFATGTGGLVLGLAAAAAGLAVITKAAYDYIESINEVEKAEQSLLATQSKAIIQNKDRIASSKKTIEQLEEEYQTIEDAAARRQLITKDILIKEAFAQKAREEGNRKLAGALEFEVTKLRSLRDGYDRRAKRAQDTAKKEEQYRKQASKSFEEDNKKRLQGLEEQKKKQEEVNEASKPAEKKKDSNDGRKQVEEAKKTAKEIQKAVEEVEKKPTAKAAKDDQPSKKLAEDLELRKQQREQVEGTLSAIQQQITAEEELLAKLEAQNEERKKANEFTIESDFGGVSSDASAGFGPNFGKSNLGKKKDDEDTRDADEVRRDIQRKKIQLTETREANQDVLSPGVSAGPVQLQPEVVSLFQQMVTGINSLKTSTDRAAQQSARVAQQNQRTANPAEQWARGVQETLF